MFFRIFSEFPKGFSKKLQPGSRPTRNPAMATELEAVCRSEASLDFFWGINDGIFIGIYRDYPSTII